MAFQQAPQLKYLMTFPHLLGLLTPPDFTPKHSLDTGSTNPSTSLDKANSSPPVGQRHSRSHRPRTFPYHPSPDHRALAREFNPLTPSNTIR